MCIGGCDFANVWLHAAIGNLRRKQSWTAWDVQHAMSCARSAHAALLICRTYAAEIAHNVSSLKRKSIVDRALEVGLYTSFTLMLCVPRACLQLVFAPSTTHTTVDSSCRFRLPECCAGVEWAINSCSSELPGTLCTQLNVNITNGKAKVRTEEDE